MLFTIFSVLYVLIAAAMIVLILMQRGDGANAGASFGGGSSGTVFGARGSASFLTRTTAVLAALFFILTLSMGIYLSHHGVKPNAQQTLGVMAGAGSSAPATAGTAALPAGAPASSAAPSAVPAPVQQSEVPAATPAASGSANAEIPAAPAKSSAPASSGQAPVASGGGH